MITLIGLIIRIEKVFKEKIEIQLEIEGSPMDLRLQLTPKEFGDLKINVDQKLKITLERI